MNSSSSEMVMGVDEFRIRLAQVTEERDKAVEAREIVENIRIVRELRAVEAQRDRLYADLLKYGNHLPKCGQRGTLVPQICSCEFRIAIAVNHPANEEVPPEDMGVLREALMVISENADAGKYWSTSKIRILAKSALAKDQDGVAES